MPTANHKGMKVDRLEKKTKNSKSIHPRFQAKGRRIKVWMMDKKLQAQARHNDELFFLIRPGTRRCLSG